MTIKQLLAALELKLNSLETRNKDLERENFSLKTQLSQNKELLAEKK